jgi:hypothetical protein
MAVKDISGQWKRTIRLMGSVLGKVLGEAMYAKSQFVKRNGQISGKVKFVVKPKHVVAFVAREAKAGTLTATLQSAIDLLRTRYEIGSQKRNTKAATIEKRMAEYRECEATGVAMLVQLAQDITGINSKEAILASANGVSLAIGSAVIAIIANVPTVREWQGYVDQHGVGNRATVEKWEMAEDYAIVEN